GRVGTTNFVKPHHVLRLHPHGQCHQRSSKPHPAQRVVHLHVHPPLLFGDSHQAQAVPDCLCASCAPTTWLSDVSEQACGKSPMHQTDAAVTVHPLKRCTKV